MLCLVEGQLSGCGLGKGSQDATAVSAGLAPSQYTVIGQKTLEGRGSISIGQM